MTYKRMRINSYDLCQPIFKSSKDLKLTVFVILRPYCHLRSRLVLILALNQRCIHGWTIRNFKLGEIGWFNLALDDFTQHPSTRCIEHDGIIALKEEILKLDD